ncbi:zinc finger protein [Cryptosporidium bovis]|uniref:zinc finger protein n=1 Tax=Cryptosporidium bovis TaxID=310047 RepID=UPI00351A9F55|nr:zinc finger protein [Cryptosporidium bovis]
MSNRRPCQFFIRGSCRFGDNCRDYHPKGALFDGSSQPSSFRNSNNNSNAVFGSSNNVSNELFNPFNNNKNQSNLNKLSNSNSNPTLQTLELIGIVVNSGVWPFGKIGLLNQIPMFTSLDLSFEEYRFRFYQNDRSSWESLHFETLRILNEHYKNFIENGKAQGYLPIDHKLYNLDLSKYSKIGNIYLPNLGREFVSSDSSKGPFGNSNANNNCNSSFSSSVSTSPFVNPFSSSATLSSNKYNPFSVNDNSTGIVFGSASGSNNSNSFFSGFNTNSTNVFGGNNNSINTLTESSNTFTSSNPTGNAFGGFPSSSNNNPFSASNSFNNNIPFLNSTNSGDSINMANNTQTSPFEDIKNTVFSGNSSSPFLNNSPFSVNQNTLSSNDNLNKSSFSNSISPFNGNKNIISQQQSIENPFSSSSPSSVVLNDQKVFPEINGSSSTSSFSLCTNLPYANSNNVNANNFFSFNSNNTNNNKYSFNNPDVNDETVFEGKQELLPWEYDAFTSKSFDCNKIPEKIPPKSLRT